MRGEALFDDLEAQFAAVELADRAAAVGELTRAERATVRLEGRVRAAIGQPILVRVRGGEQLAGELVDAAAEWLMLAEGPRRYLVPTQAVAVLRGLPGQVEPDSGRVARRLGLAHALRALSRDRVAVRLDAQGVQLRGRLDAVGADHVDLVALDESGRGRPERWAVPISAIDVVAST